MLNRLDWEVWWFGRVMRRLTLNLVRWRRENWHLEQILGACTSTRASPAGLEEVVYAKTFIWRFASGLILRCNLVGWRPVILIRFCYILGKETVDLSQDFHEAWWCLRETYLPWRVRHCLKDSFNCCWSCSICVEYGESFFDHQGLSKRPERTLSEMSIEEVKCPALEAFEKWWKGRSWWNHLIWFHGETRVLHDVPMFCLKNVLSLVTSRSAQNKMFISSSRYWRKCFLAWWVAIFSFLAKRQPHGACLNLLRSSEANMIRIFPLLGASVEIIANILQWKWVQLSGLPFLERPALHSGNQLVVVEERWESILLVF